MPLLPQHFQMQSLHASGHAALLAGAARQHFWGVLDLAYEVAGLSDGRVRITKLDAILPDGLVIRHAHDDPVLEIDVKQALGSPDQILTVHLAVPPLYRGGRIDPRATRYRQHQSEDVVDLSTGEDPMAITIWRPRLHLLVDLGDHEYERLPLMRLRQQGGGVGLAPYVPPCPFVTPADMLGKRVARVLTRIREKCVLLSGRLDAARWADEREDVDLIARQLSVLWIRLPEIEAALNATAVHPLDLYCALAGMAGALAGLQPGAGVPAFAPFDYMELLASYKPLLEFIDSMLDMIRQNYRVHQFMKCESGFWIELPPAPGNASHTELVIGLRMPGGASEGDAATWLAGAVIASRSHLPTLARQRMGGLARRPLSRVERASYSVSDDTVMFALSVTLAWFDPSQPLHIDVRNTGRAVLPWAIQLFTPDADTTGGDGDARENEHG